MVNRIVLVGRLVADPEIRYTANNIPVANFRIAVDRPFKSQSGEKETDFINIVAWRQTAEFAANYLKKGRLVACDGRLQIRQWTAQDGQRRNTAEVVADSVQGLDRPSDAGSTGPASTRTSGSEADAKSAAGPNDLAPPPDDGFDDTDPWADQ